ncbi:hypothetical protein I6E23_10285 [Prevotella brevis]|nr:hypothetical protein [Xylanibacter brevis]
MSKKEKYIITGPKSKQGGVASFVNNITPALDLDGDVTVFRRGSESRKSPFSRIIDSLSLPK